ncbi:MAG TPA: hypothetical protein VGG23_07160 [Acidimicrobiales bacterium]
MSRRADWSSRLVGPAARPGSLVSIVALVGAALLIWSAVIHLHLWATGYRHIPRIGPLFLVQGVAGIVVAVAIAALRRPIVLAGGALFAAGTVGGLLLSVNVGLFGFQDSLSAPFAVQSLVVETIAFAVLGGAAVLEVTGGGRHRPEPRDRPRRRAVAAGDSRLSRHPPVPGVGAPDPNCGLDPPGRWAAAGRGRWAVGGR